MQMLNLTLWVAIQIDQSCGLLSMEMLLKVWLNFDSTTILNIQTMILNMRMCLCQFHFFLFLGQFSSN